MIAAAAILTELYLSCAALLGLVVLQRVLVRRDADDPLNRRFLFGLRVTMLLFAGRILQAVTGVAAFRILELLGAALIPLAVLILTEGLLRRHASPVFKVMIGGGAVCFGLGAFWFSDSIDPARLWAMMGFQTVGFLVSGWMILSRDRASLTPSENMMVVRLGLSLIPFIPLAAADFLLQRLALPIQFSALGVLILCWLAIGLGRSQQGHRATLGTLGLLIGAAVLAGGLIGGFAGFDRDGVLLSVAVILATLFVVTILSDARTLRQEEQSLDILRALAAADVEEPMDFLRQLQDHPRVEGAVVIDESHLSGLDRAVLTRIFDAAPVLRRADPPVLGPVADDHIQHLFQSYAATHIIRAINDPPVLVALAMPSLSASPTAELELQVVQRMAALMARAKGQDNG